MEAKEWAKVFRGLENFTSDDKTRLMLNHVHVPDERHIEATDGHKLIRVETKAPHGLAPGFYEPKQTIALCKAGLAPQPVAQATVAANGWTYPDFSIVIPKLPEEGEEVKVAPMVGLSLAYLAEIGEGMAAVLGPWGVGKSLGAKVRFGESELSPIRFDAQAHDEASAVVVLMPMRV